MIALTILSLLNSITDDYEMPIYTLYKPAEDENKGHSIFCIIKYFIPMKKIIFAIFVFLPIIGFSQDQFKIQFQDESIQIQENIHSFDWSQMPVNSKLANGYIGWVQFYHTPTQNIQDQFKAMGLELINYIPNKTYLFYFPENTSVEYLRSSGVRAIVPVEGRFKLSEDLKNGTIGEWAQENGKILVTLQYHKYVDYNFVMSDLAERQISLKQAYIGSNNIDLLIPDNCLEDLSNLAYVKWVELIVAPDVKDDTRGRSLHRASNLDTQGAGRNYTGDGIGVLVRDDGIVGPHIDFQGRIDNSGASGTNQSHGDGVGGIMAGAGNLNPDMRGMAAGSDVFIVNYVANFLDSQTVTLINSGEVQITNSSYSNGCNAGYTTITQTVDLQTQNIPTLLHVFSAGNSNNNNCGYGAGSQWGNITGGHKQGKNVIATANVFFDGSLVNSSSRGPAHDGRIKPDIAANGQNQNSTNENNTYQVFGGTSGAAPGIAGISAQLYEAYQDINGTLPESALIKATLLNTANDYGNIGPDFKFGWGIVNALRAGILIEEGRYLSDDIIQGVTNTHTINVPSGTSQVRFMVYWSDAPASPGASPALVNDLDLVVSDPSSNTYLPWILDPTPNPVNLDTPATNGVDRLNNMEQVLINNPAAGNYELDVTGFNVPIGPQNYFIVYEIIQENLTITYPNDGESFVPGQTESIHWDAINTSSGFTLEYSTNNGASWNAITTVANTVTNFAWTVPSTLTGEAKIRITSGAFSDESDGTFSIAAQVTGLTLTEVCPTEAVFTWNSVVGAESYDLYILGDKYMEVVGNSTTTSITVPIANATDPMWYSIVAKNDTDGWKTKRLNASFYSGGILNCSLANDIALVAINNLPEDFSDVCGGPAVIISVNIANPGINPQSNFTVSYQLSGEPPVQETYSATLNSGDEVTYNFTTPLAITSNNSYTLTTLVDLSGDSNSTNNEKLLDFYAQVEPTEVPFLETFDSSNVPPLGWSIINPDNGITWDERNVIGIGGIQTKVAYMDNFGYPAVGAEDYLMTEYFDLGAVSSPVLTFALAKAQFSESRSDTLKVEISTDCGNTFTTIYEKTGLELSTIPDYNTSIDWSPATLNDWRRELIDLSSYTGENVLFRFVNINDLGNSTHIDNINVTDALLNTPQFTASEIRMYPNPTSETVSLYFGNTIIGETEIKVSNSLGQVVTELKQNIAAQSTVNINVTNYAQGIYFVTIKTETGFITKKLIKK
ncbi:MAG: S8 family serine peptidase [Flavobacteriaceae bacterium]